MSKITPLETICPTIWHGVPVPQRRWLIPDLLVRGSVTMLNGDGGVGKSLLAQQLATAMATRRPFLGLQPHDRPVPALAVFCEDDLQELHFRQERINAHYGCAMSDLGALTLVSRVSLENELMVFDRRDIGEESNFYRQLAHTIRETGAELIVVDTAADTFMGNEIIRPQVRQFINALRRLAAINDGGVILTAHPSLTGLNSGSGLSGSTAWNNSVRGRLYLTRPIGGDGEDETNDARVLKLMKSNYGPSGNQLRLRWLNHVFVLEDEGGTASDGGLVDRIAIEVAVLGGLRRLVANGALVPADPDAPNGLANKVRKLPACRRWDWQSVVAAQERLTAAGRIVKVEMGPPSKRRIYVRPHDMRLPGEVSVGDTGR